MGLLRATIAAFVSEHLWLGNALVLKVCEQKGHHGRGVRFITGTF